MLSSKASKIIKSMLFCLLLVVCSSLLTFLLYPYSSLNKHFARYHKISQNIDFLILGNSLENSSIIPSIISENFKLHCEKLTPQGSYPESIYYMLVDAGNKHKVKTLLIGWDILQNFQLPAYKYPHSEELYREFLSDLKGNTELKKIVFKNIMNQRYTSTFFDWSSFPENITQIPKVIESKKDKSFESVTQAHTTYIDETTLKTDERWNYYEAVNRSYGSKIQENDKFYLLKIHDYCKKHNINLYVISCPVPQCVYDVHPELSTCIDISKEFFKSNDIKYIDTTNQNFFPEITKNSHFYDCFGHMSRPFNEIYTQYVCDWLKNHNFRQM